MSEDEFEPGDARPLQGPLRDDAPRVRALARSREADRHRLRPRHQHVVGSGTHGIGRTPTTPWPRRAIAALTVSIAREMGKYGVRSNFIAPRARTRMTMSMPNHAMFDEPAEGFDANAPRLAGRAGHVPRERARSTSTAGLHTSGAARSSWSRAGTSSVRSPRAAPPSPSRTSSRAKTSFFGTAPREPAISSGPEPAARVPASNPYVVRTYSARAPWRRRRSRRANARYGRVVARALQYQTFGRGPSPRSPGWRGIEPTLSA